MPKKSTKAEKDKSTFFKDPLESISVHLGKIIDKSSVKDVVEGILMGALALRAYQVFEGNIDAPIVACIGYKLATTMGGTPPASQIAGLAILGSIGYVSITGTEGVMKIPGTDISIPIGKPILPLMV